MLKQIIILFMAMSFNSNLWADESIRQRLLKAQERDKKNSEIILKKKLKEPESSGKKSQEKSNDDLVELTDNNGAPQQEKVKLRSIIKNAKSKESKSEKKSKKIYGPKKIELKDSILPEEVVKENPFKAKEFGPKSSLMQNNPKIQN